MSSYNPLLDVNFVLRHIIPRKSRAFCTEFVKRLRCRLKYNPSIPEAKKMLMRPDLLLSEWNDMDPYDGTYSFHPYDYGSNWYSDETWHPEMLFVNPNKKYWQDLDVWTSSSGDTCNIGLGKRYMRPVYGGSNTGQFPHWAVSPHNRPYNKTTSGLREGGLSDRRVQVNKGYAYNDLSSRKDYKYIEPLRYNIHR